MIELEELDVTKQAWKDLYGRSGIKKGYNGLFLEKIATEAYGKLAATITEAEFNIAAQHFQTVLDRTQIEAKHSFEETYYASADVALLSDAFVDNAAELLLKRLKEPIREVKETFTPSALLKNQPVLLIPSGALTGFNDSPMVKASLDEYVKAGGTLIVLSQKHGYDYASIPTPDGRPITGYGWEEDQNCFADSVAIETWHQLLSGQSRATPTLNVDGYFTGYPANATVLLRRTANGQPAMLIYEHGLGRVIVTSMYSDWAYGHGQASEEEIALIRDLLSWAKKPAALPEMKPGETITVPVTLTNSTATDAASIKLQIWNPDRSTLLLEQSVSTAIPAGQSLVNNVTWQALPNAALGIYHIDYLLLDSSGAIIQPQAETDSGRFVVSSPPQTGTLKKDIWLSITSPNQEVFFNEPFLYTFHIFNNSATTRNLTLKSWLPHTNRWHEWPVTATATGETTINGSDLFIDRYMFETLRAYLYDESGTEIGSYMLSFKGVYPQVTVTTVPAKPAYTRGETVDFSVDLTNSRSMAVTVKLKMTGTDPANSSIFTSSSDVILAANGNDKRNLSFPLPPAAQGGVYTVATEVLDLSGVKIGGDSAAFELPLSQVSVSPLLPAAVAAGNNAFSFSLHNTGQRAVNSGLLDLTFTDPTGEVLGAVSRQFTLEAGQITIVEIPVTISALKFGTYSLVYRESDETGSSKATTILIANSPEIGLTFDKPSYRIRETVHASLNIMNTGRFNLENVVVAIAIADAGYNSVETVSSPPYRSSALNLAMPLPAVMTAGKHAVKVTLTAPGGSTFGTDFTLHIPGSSLAVDSSDPNELFDLPVTIENSGGVDSGYVTEKLLLEDNKGVVIYQGAVSGTVNAGEKKLLMTIPLPKQMVKGTALLQIQLRDTKTGKLSFVYKSVELGGVEAALSTHTDKSQYHAAEPILAATNMTNGTSAIENGILDVTVTAMKSTESGEFSVFLPNATGATTDRPHGVAIGADGSVYVADTFNHRVLKLDANGDSVAQWGGYGSGSGQFMYLQALAIDNDGNVYVADTNNHRVQKFDSNGSFITQWGSYGSGNGQFRFTDAVAIGPDGFVYVTDKGNSRVQKFDGNGNFVATWGGYGGGDGQFIWPWGIAVSPDNFVFVVDRNYPRIQKFDNAGNFVSKWGGSGIGEGEFSYPHGIAVDMEGSVYVMDTGNNRIQKFYRDGTFVRQIGNYGNGNGQFNGVTSMGIMADAFIYVTDTSNSRIQKMALQKEMATIFASTKTVNLAPLAVAEEITGIGALNAAGKLYLRSKLTNSLGQTVAAAEHPFFIFNGKVSLLFETDRKIYKPSELVRISGAVKNTAAVPATVVIELTEKSAISSEKILLSETFTIPVGGSTPFTVTTAAGNDGIITIRGEVTESGIPLAQIADQYEVASPKATASLTAPDVAGSDQFVIGLELKNSGKVEAAITVGKSFDPQLETVTIPAGQTKLLQYSRQISADTTDTFILSGDLTQTITKTVKYGPAVALSAAPRALYPEGKVSLPLTVTNSGLIDSQFSVDCQLNQGASSVSQQSKSYFLAKGASSSDHLFFDLGEGNYQLTATSQTPSGSATAAFQVRKEVKAELALAIGSQDGALLPATVAVTNHGYNPIEGAVRVAFVADNGTTAWTASQDISLPPAVSPAPRSLPFSVNLAALTPGSYTVRAELLDAGNRQLAYQPAPFTLTGPTIAITQLPPSRTIPSGGSSDFTFRVKNSGNQEGKFDLSFKADDLTNITRSEWLKPGEEKEITFALQAADDLDEKDYFATYNLKKQGSDNEQGTVRYHLQGLKLAVTAILDKQSYNVGDSATLTLNVAQQGSGAAPDLFARVNYNGYNGKQAFTLNGSQTLTFSVPLESISGEKLFYGIYAASGRSLHLNTIYIYKADGQLALATDRQVYTPGETVTVAISGSASGDLTLTGPGDFSTTFAYGGAASQSFTLPATMTAGTYTLKAQLNTSDSQLITAAHPFDVSGIQVKVKEALLDKSRYRASDSMQLSLVIESNRELATTVRTWIVDPTGSYTPTGEAVASLTAAAPLLTSVNAQLSTASLGIHKLVYGIYQGDLLLASGAKAFDIGAAVLTGLATDRSDYPAVTMPVTVTAELYGSLAVGIDFLLDGASIKTDTVPLAGSGSYTVTIPPASLTPGLHSLKAVVSVDGLASSRELRFTYDSSLPDLVARVAVAAPQGGTAAVAVTVTNQGKTAAGGSRTALYDGDPANGGQLLTTLATPAISAGGAVTLSYSWNVLGRSGDHVLYAVADSDNAVVEFIEGNNRAITATTLPAASLAVSTGKSAFEANETAAIAITVANLSATLPMDNAVLKLRLVSSGTTIDLPDLSVGSVAPVTTATLTELWNIGTSLPGSYAVEARLVSAAAELAAAGGGFAILPTPALSGTIFPVMTEVPQESILDLQFSVTSSGNVPLDGRLRAVIRDPQSGADAVVRELPLQLPVGAAKAGGFSLPLTGLAINSYDLLLQFLATGSETAVARSRFTIRDTLLPSLTLSTLADGSHTRLEILNISGSAGDNSGSVLLDINGVPVAVAADGSFSHALLLQDGPNLITTTAIDPTQNRTSDTRSVILDRTAPLLTVDTPADNSKTAIAPIEVTGSVDEASTVTVKVKENILTAAMNGTTFAAMVFPEPGLNTIEITATDLAGNPSSQKRSVLFDDQAPSLTITEPGQDIRTNKSSITVGGKTSDPYTAVGVTIDVAGQTYTPQVIAGIFSQTVTFSEEKLYPITVTASNEVGTQTVVQRNVIYDRTPPVLTIDPVTTPTNAPHQIVTGTREAGTKVTISCMTAIVGAVAYPTANRWQAAVSGLTQGENRLRAETIDLAGNLTTATATIQYVPRAPDVTINASPQTLWPPNKKLIAVTINGNVVTYGSDIREVSISVADEYGTYNQQGLKFGDTVLLEAWREGSDRDGRIYTITAIVTDQAGNRTARSTTVVVPHDLGK